MTDQRRESPRAASDRVRRVSISLFVSAFAVYASLYTTQPILPLLTQALSVTPAAASLTISGSTLALAFAMLVTGAISDSRGRKPIVVVSLFATALIGILAALAPSFTALLVLRGLEGIALAGVPATAMAYLSEEIAPRQLGVTMGLYVSGTTVGGLLGRIVAGTVADQLGWRAAIAAIALFSLVCALFVSRYLPPSRNFQPRALNLRAVLGALGRPLGDPRLRYLYVGSFLLMGSFVALYNYIGFDLIAPPYSLSATLVSWIFLIYLVGTFSSSFLGRLADRYGRGIIRASVSIMLIGAVVTAAPVLPVKILGVVLFTFGFFGSHSIASSWVSAVAGRDAAPASALYLLFYYLGSSLAGTTGGLLYARDGWTGVVGLLVGCIGLALVSVTLLSGLTVANQSDLQPSAVKLGLERPEQRPGTEVP